MTRLLGLAVVSPLLLALSLAVAVGIARGPDLGLTVHDLRVVTVRPLGPAAAAGLRPGDRVASVDGRNVPDMHAYYAAVARERGLVPRTFVVQDADGERTAVLQPARPVRAHLLRDYTSWLTGPGVPGHRLVGASCSGATWWPATSSRCA